MLIVEDDDAIAELMRTIVEDEGWTCAACRSTYELPAGAFDVVVTDLGAGAYTRAAATAWVAPIHAAFPGVPVVIVTAHGAAKRDAKALELVRYNLSQSDRQSMRERGGDPEDNFTPDFPIKFARDLVQHMPASKRPDAVAAAAGRCPDGRYCTRSRAG